MSFPFEMVYEHLVANLILNGIPKNSVLPATIKTIRIVDGQINITSEFSVAQFMNSPEKKGILSHLIKQSLLGIPENACLVLTTEAYARELSYEDVNTTEKKEAALRVGSKNSSDAIEVVSLNFYRPDSHAAGYLPIDSDRKLIYRSFEEVTDHGGRLGGRLGERQN